MKATLNVYKRRGETPLACLERLQESVPELRGQSLTYAGRLDPLAEGVLVVLVGDEARRKDAYLELRKTYCAEILFGFSTDTYDLAGKLTEATHGRVPMIQVMDSVGALEGLRQQAYPPFSSKPVMGKPLWQWTRENRLNEIIIPTHEVRIYRSLMRHSETIQGEDLRRHIMETLKLMKGDFRQEEIAACWEDNLKSHYGDLYDIATIEIDCSSGTYIRSIAHELGQSVGIPALAYRIVRTKVGTYSIEESLRDFSPATVAQSI